jgi:iron complex outermembrane receptor protein
MCSSSRFFLFFACAITIRAQTPVSSSPAAAAGPSPEGIQHLDTFVVSAGPDPKTAFDLAQGTSVLAGEELRRQVQATLGETLASTPGVSSTYYGPGASRPVIRGLGGDRIRVLDNGVGSLDASNISPDHNTALEPLFASRIEVLRGPSTLLYGSSAVGGAVNVIDNSIPDTAPDGTTHGNLEFRYGGAAGERAAVASVGGGGRGLALHLNALRQMADDARIPGVARIDADAPGDQPRGTLPNSAIETQSAALGAGGFWTAGHAGLAVSHYATDYGVPTGEPDTHIRMRQTRGDFAADITAPFGIFRGAKARFGFGDYTHSELSGPTVNTTFRNRAWEGRLELSHATSGNLSGTIGAQVSRSDFAAVGEEVVTPPSRTQTGAIFALEEFKAGRETTLQVGGRIEGESIRLGAVDPALPAVPGYAARSGQEKNPGGASASVGIVFHPAKDWSIAAALACSERLPTAQELFSNGPHGGTAAYEVGSTGLGDERSLGVDLSVRRRAGFVTGVLGGFMNRFQNYVFEQQLPAGAIPLANNPDGLTPFQFVAKDARFFGGEVELEFHLLEETTRHLHLALKSDYVRAEQTDDHQPLPRITPWRTTAQLEYRHEAWIAAVEWRHAGAQDRVAPGESPTGGYSLLGVNASYSFASGRTTYEFFLRGTNLTDRSAREHTSFLKEVAPLPGRGVLGGLRATF